LDFGFGFGMSDGAGRNYTTTTTHLCRMGVESGNDLRGHYTTDYRILRSFIHNRKTSTFSSGMSLAPFEEQEQDMSLILIPMFGDQDLPLFTFFDESPFTYSRFTSTFRRPRPLESGSVKGSNDATCQPPFALSCRQWKEVAGMI
jgi:hypothetical protein